MALGPRPVANASVSQRRRLMRAGLLGLCLVAPVAHALDVNVEPYREARRAGALGVVEGRIYAEPRTPGGRALPMTGGTVTLLPWSAALEARLQQLKEQARESSTRFADAAPAMRKAKEDYERELVRAGAPDLAIIVAVDATGAFRIPDVPAGAWLVLAWHSLPVDVTTSKTTPKDRKLYQPRARLHGYQSVTVWLRDVKVAGGKLASLDLTDRNGWFRGVVEERELDVPRPSRP
jgi:hypothetical protein